MLRRIATFFLLALAGTTLGLPDTAAAAGFRGGFRGGPAFHGPVMRGLPRPVFRGHTAVPRTIVGGTLVEGVDESRIKQLCR